MCKELIVVKDGIASKRTRTRASAAAAAAAVSSKNKATSHKAPIVTGIIGEETFDDILNDYIDEMMNPTASQPAKLKVIK